MLPEIDEKKTKDNLLMTERYSEQDFQEFLLYLTNKEDTILNCFPPFYLRSIFLNIANKQKYSKLKILKLAFSNTLVLISLSAFFLLMLAASFALVIGNFTSYMFVLLKATTYISIIMIPFLLFYEFSAQFALYSKNKEQIFSEISNFLLTKKMIQKGITCDIKTIPGE